MLFVSLSIEIFIAVIVALLIAVVGVFFILKESKKKKLYLTQVVYKLMQEKFEDVNHDEKINLYDVSFKYNNKNFFIKIYKGGPRKGIIMTNPTTIFDVTYTSSYGPSTNKEVVFLPEGGHSHLRINQPEEFDNIIVSFINKN